MIDLIKDRYIILPPSPESIQREFLLMDTKLNKIVHVEKFKSNRSVEDAEEILRIRKVFNDKIKDYEKKEK